ncbi:hypothetical protein DYB25_013430 [Aphanomyces astaci]|uniref:Uncharacterized protein n=1 Tax=Aphanomyces astaci TaxID=112090 RepID=A0A397E678_APHAT|nr:hypothetical protein DYB25_013430 [Aphanomyces astaci]RHY62666.1 hypothetical protein DYB38_003230 [Aphanomyces astaci]RHY76341.1 hypothetical protein DYB30_013545 [Aphanomyces astaci]RHY82033.1 hypothetical protein DYB26_013083 [Aphanomyces astaci]RHY99835.1 hypothetical protein DYB31_014621 [Aphanomyces astaci]
MDDCDALEIEKDKRFYYLKMQETFIRGLFGKVLPADFLVQLQGTINSPTLQLHEVWAMLEREYGQSSLDVSTALYSEFISLPTKPFNRVTELVKHMRSLQNQLNELARKNLGEIMISDYHVSQALVAALPSGYFGSSVIQTHDGFKLPVIETMLKQIFSNKSSKDIAAMSKLTVMGERKRPIAVNQAKVNEVKKTKVSSYTECFYCHGTANVYGTSHMKATCPLRISDGG